MRAEPFGERGVKAGVVRHGSTLPVLAKRSLSCGTIDQERTEPRVTGILFVDKDEGWTSHDAVAKARRVLGTRKVGHAGTLDPMATGLLTLGVGSATRLLTHMVGLDKTYTATMRLGESTLSDDRMSDITATAPAGRIASLSDEALTAAIRELTGDIEQVPSAVSAIKVDGKRAYDRVRDGEEVALKSRRVSIYSFDLHSTEQGSGSSGTPVLDLHVTVRCSSGTYIRALARDLGSALGIGGHLTALRRTAVGPFALPDHVPSDGEHTLEVQAVTTTDIVAGKGADLVVTPTEVARALFPVIELSEAQAIDLANGKKLDVQHDDAGLVAAIGPRERLVGLVSVKNGLTRVVTNFPAPVQGE